MSNNLTDVSIATANYGFVKMCDVIPFIGNIAADIAQDIINLANNANHNKEACRYISECVQRSLTVIAMLPLQGDYSESQKAYEKVLNEIKSYAIEINKPGKFSKKVKTWLKHIVNANNVQLANEKLLLKLTDATLDFNSSLKYDQFIELIEIFKKTENNESINALKIMLIKKDNITNEEIKGLKINPLKIKNENDEKDDCNYQDDDNKRAVNSIRKRIYCGEFVAVKKMIYEKESDNEYEQRKRQKIVKQSRILNLLGACEYIEKFIGAYTKKYNELDFIFIVTTWMQKGNLEAYLAKNKSISWETKLKIAEQIAKGLTYCNNAGVYHRDVRSKSVLLDENLDIKLTNFEKSRIITGETSEMPIDRKRWTAPEKLIYPKLPYTEKCEIYSFATLLWEISAQQIPFSDMSHRDAENEIKKGKRPKPFSSDTPEKYKRLVEQAWHQEPKKRPEIEDIRKKLTMMNMHYLEDTKSSLLLSIEQVVLLHEQQRFEEAFPLFLHIAQEGNPLASYYAGFYLYEGNYGVERDEIKALQLLQKSAVGGNVRGQYMYANACLYGTYYSRKEGLKYLKNSADKNCPDALYMLSQIYKNGEHGYEINDNKYKEYLSNAANNESEIAQRELEILKMNKT